MKPLLITLLFVILFFSCEKEHSYYTYSIKSDVNWSKIEALDYGNQYLIEGFINLNKWEYTAALPRKAIFKISCEDSLAFISLKISNDNGVEIIKGIGSLYYVYKP